MRELEEDSTGAGRRQRAAVGDLIGDTGVVTLVLPQHNHSSEWLKQVEDHNPGGEEVKEWKDQAAERILYVEMRTVQVIRGLKQGGGWENIM